MRRTLALGLAVVAASAVLCVGGFGGSPSRAATPATLLRTASTTPVPANIQPPLARATVVLPRVYADGCHQHKRETRVPPCVYGDPKGKTTIVLFGDSHASQWFPPIDHFATVHHDRLVSLTHSFCPAAVVPLHGSAAAACTLWRHRALRRIRSEHPDLIVIGSMPPALLGDDGSVLWDGDEHARIWRAGYDAVLRRLHRYTPHILLLSDSRMRINVPRCLEAHLDDAGACTTPRDESIDPVQVGIEHDLVDQDDVGLIVTTAWTCPSDPCPGIIGNILVWRDVMHLTPVVTEKFKGRIANALARALASQG
jgi:hypothetical protein